MYLLLDDIINKTIKKKFTFKTYKNIKQFI